MAEEIRVPGGSLYVADQGESRAGRRPVVLVHGLGYSADVWRQVAARLAEDTRVVTFDLRGHGWSTAESSTPEEVWRDVAVVVEAMGLDRPVLVGHDVGAYFVAAAEATRPGTAGAVVSIDWPLGLPRPEAEQMLADITGDDILDILTGRFDLGATGPDEASRVRFVDRLVEKIGEDWMTAETGAANARTGLERSILVADDGSWVRRPTPAEVRVVARVPADSPAYPDASLWERITCPTWFVHADDGPYADLLPTLEAVTAAAPHRHLVRVAGGHHLEQTHPQEIVQIVRGVLADGQD